MSQCEQCLVRRLNPLKELNKGELVRISNCRKVKIIRKGEPLFNEGDHINGIFCVKSGVCKISKISDNGREQIINLIKRGNIIGERSLISDEVANLRATALEEMEVCFIPKDEIIRNLHDNHSFTMAMLKNMAESLKETDNAIVDMAQKTVKQRLAITLLYLFETFGTNKNGCIDLHLTREDLSNIIGTATESAIRLLSEFKKKNIINLKGKRISILDIRELKAIKEGLT